MDHPQPLEQRSSLALLYDIYGDLLSDRLRAAVQLTLEEDCSLQEIGEAEGVSRQAVHQRFKRGEHALKRYEAKLGLLAAWQAQQACMAKLQQALEARSWPQMEAAVQELRIALEGVEINSSTQSVYRAVGLREEGSDGSI